MGKYDFLSTPCQTPHTISFIAIPTWYTCQTLCCWQVQQPCEAQRLNCNTTFLLTRMVSLKPEAYCQGC